MKVLGVFKASKETREVPAGAVIFEEGAVGEEMFGVIEGKVELKLANGRSVTLGPDETFGEMALVDRSPRSATAVAAEDTKLAVIDKIALPLPDRRDAAVRAAGDGQPRRPPAPAAAAAAGLLRARKP